ncbi:5-formyltetrahydrofolate cyclo-ligase [Marinicella sediminis]|uniref:5-formyltetrahydrofolate cyclo-ligase n=1 Tax=Marinicella sediminis TaxID=1792834 RepID=A0ABV7JG23_9GAMM|nr:5-formyltetrahydrofolate cyclo-ligase [Marinicella sediminis]
MLKTELRADLRQRRAAIRDDERSGLNRRLIRHISASSLWQEARHVGLYLAFNREADITALLEQSDDKNLYLPAISGKLMQFQPVTSQMQMETLSYGLQQPVFIPGASQPDIDLYLMPLLGFDGNGNRLGMGGGYYDRYFAEHHAGIRAGIAYACQQVQQLPTDPWDVTLQHIFTEQGHHEF